MCTNQQNWIPQAPVTKGITTVALDICIQIDGRLSFNHYMLCDSPGMNFRSSTKDQEKRAKLLDMAENSVELVQ